MTFSVRFWGVRGSIACCGPRTARFGGNTSCVEMRCGARLLMFDAGTGIRYLGRKLLRDKGPIDADVFFTHTHFDHVCGLPFFAPAFQAQNSFRLWAGHLGDGLTLRRVMSEFMIAPLFPVPPDVFKANMEYRDFAPGDTLNAGDAALRTAVLNHPDGAVGYRVDYGGKSVCYVTDTEHVPGAPDKNVLGLIAGADLVIYDSMYTDEEYNDYVGWGHSTWQEGIRLCKSAGARRLAVFHHDPEHDDEQLSGIEREVAAALPGSVVAREGLVIEL